MGKYPDQWDKHLDGISQRNYNMVHFAPLMKRGISNSPYSIYDQLQFDPDIFPGGEDDIARMVSNMEQENGLLSMTDVVWNHTAGDSYWLEGHPEAGYNVQTAPWLEAALELDSALLGYGSELQGLGLVADIRTAGHLEAIIDGVKDHVIKRIKLWEFYDLDVTGDAQRLLEAWKDGQGQDLELSEYATLTSEKRVEFICDKAIPAAGQILGRSSRAVDPRFGAAMLASLFGSYSPDSAAAAKEHITNTLNDVNLSFYREYDEDVAIILGQLQDRIRYLRLDDHGPKLGSITDENPLIETYFTRLPLNETTRQHDSKALALANNGWIWNADSMRDHAGPESKAYLRREVIVWGDCVKLRYGSGPEDNPFLWSFMTKYTRLMARYFSGFRIDNCHSTPLVVAEYLLSQAREVRPDLVVFAELFTGSEEADYVFVKRLGINALIREAMQAWSTEELSRLVHRHGGRPIGSFDISDTEGQREAALYRVQATPVQALFMDCTHDNEMPSQKRTAQDTLPNAALVALCASATGSVMGFDEIYPQLVDLVHERRLYASAFSDIPVLHPGSGKNGIGGVKKLLNELHTRMGMDGYDETHIHHDGEYITVHRVHPSTRKGIFLIAHTAFPGCYDGKILPPTLLVGTSAKEIGTWALEVQSDDDTKAKVLADANYLHGLPSQVHELDGSVTIEQKDGDTTIFVQETFIPGAISLFETSIPSAEHSDGLDNFITQGATEAFSDLNLVDLNFVLYRCDAEERDSSDGKDGVYSVPRYGPLVYAGLQGWWSVLEDIIKNNELGHPLCDHLRNGRWAFDYIIGRMERAAQNQGYTALEKPAQWMRERFEAVRRLPSFLLPRYFAIIVQTAYSAAWKQGVQCMGSNIRSGNAFVQQLAMVSVQQTGYVQSASLWPTRRVSCLAAGLPHFATSWARCWGRDVFISLRGLFLCTGRYDDAKKHILAFASVLKHGMIPNLLNSGMAPRYNSRDSVWFLLQAIQDYTVMAPGGERILDESVERRFLPYDDTWFPFDDPRAYSQSSTVRDIVQEVFQRHANGLSFREYNAGPELDVQMKLEGFQIDVQVDWTTGFIFGGSQFNCGTWQDKMGESEKAENKGVPGSPRDGAAVEITGLVYSALTWVARLIQDGLYTNRGVQADGKEISFEDWAARIRDNFERCYYIPVNPDDDPEYEVDKNIIHRRGIYKDLYKSSTPFEDYQLRANFPIAMTVSPSLFTPERAQRCLGIADKSLLGPLGMATLDPADLNYRPFYNNGEDSTDFTTAKGRNYHQGPEWVWLRGYFLRALVQFSTSNWSAATAVSRRLEGCRHALRQSPWRGLTELTNRGGEECGDSVSCPIPVLRSQSTLCRSSAN